MWGVGWLACFNALVKFNLIKNLLLHISAFVNLLFLSVTGPLSELQIAYVCRETLQVNELPQVTKSLLWPEL